MGGFGWQELLIILAVALLLFGGSRLAGIGKASGRAIREFKEETKDLRSDKKPAEVETKEAAEDKVVDATIVDETTPAEQPHNQG
ncbi:twin-arginine translocase TatA/TatE family subunit [Propionibacteriaceae bacterium Y1923]|uniref:twin-arginine translocase TatA/TatE family subunit n=1 Tax=Aestuariimicrobium sp. Y1814 TaxID=3418742 RepID=UPI003C1A0145